MTATIKTLDALKAATLRLERLETYMLHYFPERPAPEVDWLGPNGLYEAHSDVRKAVAKLVAPQLPGLIVEVIEAARADVIRLTTDLGLEMDHPLVQVPAEVEPRPHPVPRTGTFAEQLQTAMTGVSSLPLRERLTAGIGRCYPDQMDVVALLKEAAAVVAPGPPPWKSL